MNILIESSNAYYNWGDASMLVMAVDRLKQFFPHAELTLLRQHDAYYRSTANRSVDILPGEDERQLLITQRWLWGRFQQTTPLLIDRCYMQWPHMWERLSRLKIKLWGRDVSAHRTFIRRFERADLLVVTGGGFITDLFGTADQALSLIQLARTRNVPVIMFGQGIGPIRDPHLFKRARFTLPQVELIGLREKHFSRPLLHKLGVPDDRIMVTGDDAVALAYPERPDVPGDGIGVNLRIAFYSEVQEAAATVIAEVLREVSKDLDAPLHPVPLAFEGHGSDVKTIQHILDRCGVASDGGAALDSPRAVIRQAGRCRVVVTGSYHGGVFALSQGIPVVALSRSIYYDQKFHGLADQFGAGCTVLRTDSVDFKTALRQAIYAAWEQAEETRPALLEAARQQIDAAKAAYARTAQIMGKEAAREPKLMPKQTV